MSGSARNAPAIVRALARGAVALGALAAAAALGRPSDDCAAPTGERLAAAPAELLRGRLVEPRSGRPGAVPEARVYLLYYGASWCAPCRAFARTLKPIYESGEPARLGYEVVFVSRDRPGDDLAYAREAAMPWPFVGAPRDRRGRDLTELGGDVLPNLIAVDRRGRVLCRAVDPSGRSSGVRRTFDRLRAAMAPR